MERNYLRQNEFERSKVNFISNTFMHMGVGLLITAGVAYYTFSNKQLFNILISNNYVAIASFILQIALVIILSKKAERLNVTAAAILFYIFSASTGFTLSVIFALYKAVTIYTAFGFAAATFFSTAMIGYTTKKDLSGIGRFCFMALIGFIIIMLIQMFFPLGFSEVVIGFIGILIFSGLTAYDMQMIKRIHQDAFFMNRGNVQSLSVIAAMNLYLDLINLFLSFLRVFSKK